MMPPSRAIERGRRGEWDHVLTRVGDPIVWEDGVEIVPGGDGAEEVRQVGSEDNVDCWYSTTWISREGASYQRTHDAFSKTWIWSGPKMASMDAGSGCLTVRIGPPHRRRSVSVQRGIALAWVELPRECEGRKAHAKSLGGGPCCPETLGWQVAGTRGCMDGGDGASRTGTAPPPSCAEVAPLSDAVPNAENQAWKPLSYVWYGPSGNPVHAIEGSPSYLISKAGWVRSLLTGKSTRGFLSDSGRRWVPLAEDGIAWVDEAVLHTFDPLLPAPAPHRRRLVLHLASPSSNALATLGWSDKEAGPAFKDSLFYERLASLFSSSSSGTSSTPPTISFLASQFEVSVSTMWDHLVLSSRCDPSGAPYLKQILPTPLLSVCREELSKGGGLRQIRDRCVADTKTGVGRLEDERDGYNICRLGMEWTIRREIENGE